MGPSSRPLSKKMMMLSSLVGGEIGRPTREPGPLRLPGVSGLALGLIYACALAVAQAGCGSTSPSDATLGVEDLLVGSGAPVVIGDTVSVNYVGSFTNGKQFEAGK